MKAVTIAARNDGPSERFFLREETDECFIGWPATRPFVLGPVARSKQDWHLLRTGKFLD
jgi:hypothetical protein